MKVAAGTICWMRDDPVGAMRNSLPNVGPLTTPFAGYGGEVREFVNAVLENRQAYSSNGDALHAMRVINALLAKPDGVTIIER